MKFNNSHQIRIGQHLETNQSELFLQFAFGSQRLHIVSTWRFRDSISTWEKSGHEFIIFTHFVRQTSLFRKPSQQLQQDLLGKGMSGLIWMSLDAITINCAWSFSFFSFFTVMTFLGDRAYPLFRERRDAPSLGMFWFVGRFFPAPNYKDDGQWLLFLSAIVSVCFWGVVLTLNHMKLVPVPSPWVVAHFRDLPTNHQIVYKYSK